MPKFVGFIGTIYFCTFGLSLHAQIFSREVMQQHLDYTLQTDRPGQSLNAATCGLYKIQLQSGFNYTHLGYSHPINSLSTPTDIKVGIAPKFEINSNFTYRYEDNSSKDSARISTGFLSPKIGMRYSFVQNIDKQQFVGVQASFTFQSFKGDYMQEKPGGEIIFLTSHQKNRFSFATNIGLGVPGTADGFDNLYLLYTINLGFTISDQWQTFVESFGLFHHQNNISKDINFDAGFAYSPNNSWRFDITGGLLDYRFATSWFAEIGFTYSCSYLKKVYSKTKSKENKNGGGIILE